MACNRRQTLSTVAKPNVQAAPGVTRPWGRQAGAFTLTRIGTPRPILGHGAKRCRRRSPTMHADDFGKGGGYAQTDWHIPGIGHGQRRHRWMLDATSIDAASVDTDCGSSPRHPH
jgi:hypothetical protein